MPASRLAIHEFLGSDPLYDSVQRKSLKSKSVWHLHGLVHALESAVLDELSHRARQLARREEEEGHAPRRVVLAKPRQSAVR